MSESSNADPTDPRSSTEDSRDLERVVRSHGRFVAGYLRARLSNLDDAARLTQEVFLGYAGQSHLDGDADAVRRELLQSARALLERRADDWTSLCLELEADAADSTVDRTSRFKTALQSLEPAEREGIELAYGAGRTCQQIGERMRRSEGAVRQLLFRARQKLQEALS